MRCGKSGSFVLIFCHINFTVFGKSSLVRSGTQIKLDGLQPFVMIQTIAMVRTWPIAIDFKYFFQFTVSKVTETAWSCSGSRRQQAKLKKEVLILR